MIRRVLFSGAARPYPLLEGRFSPFDQMGFRFTRGQGLFTMQEHTHFYALHILAQNIGVPSRVLEFPTMADFEAELETGDYDLVALTSHVFNLETVAEMCRVARRAAPAARIVLGGYGTRCLADKAVTLLEEGREVDALCTGDGIGYLRALLGEKVEAPVSCRLPLCGSGLPWIDSRLAGSSGTILSGLGCTTKCPFCTTSAQYQGRYVEILNAESIFQAMKRYWRSSKGVNFVALIDENLLNQKAKWLELGRLIREDTEFGLSRLNYLMFASANHVSAIEPEELLLAGVDGIWIGVESLYSSLEKRKGVDFPALFSRLHAHGINTVGSCIVGFDHQMPENVWTDLDYYISLSPTLQQIGILNVVPPTADWHRMREEGRLVNEDRFSERHIYGNTFRAKHFSNSELRGLVQQAYEKSYAVNGPALLRFLEVSLNGLETCRASRHPLLREQKASLFQRRAEMYGPFGRVIAEHAPSEAVRAKALALTERFEKLLNPDAKQTKLLGDFLLKRAASESKRLAKEGLRRREEPFRVYTYPGSGLEKPYDVEFRKPLGSEAFFVE